MTDKKTERTAHNAADSVKKSGRRAANLTAAADTEAGVQAQVQPEEEVTVHAPEEETVVSDLENKIKELEQSLQDEKIRAQANVQNISRRHQTEIEEAHKYAAAKFAREILPVRDYLELALMDKSENIAALKMGVELTLKHLNSAFEAAKIKEINPEGAVFDPNQHSAVSTQESKEAPNTVLQVRQKGYSLNGRVLRPAMVVVAKAPAEEKPAAAALQE